MRSVILFLFLFIFSQSIEAQGVKFLKGKLAGVMSLAQKENKLVFIDAYTTWCGPCKAMTQNVFPKKIAGDYFNAHFVSIKMDMEKGEGKEVALKYNVRSFPTLLFLDSEGTLVHKVAGYQSAENLIKQGKKAKNPEASLTAMKERFDIGNRDPSFLLKYMELRYNMADNSHGRIAEAYLKTQKDWTSPNALKTIYKYTSDADSEMFRYLVEHKETFYRKFGASKVGRKIQSLLERKINDPEKNSLTDIQTLYRKVYPGIEGEVKASKVTQTYYRRKGDRTAFAKAVFKHYKKYPSSNADELNEVGMTFYDAVDNRKYLKKACKLVKKSIKLDNNHYNNYTLASILYKLKKKRKAKKAAYSAIALAKAQDEDYEEIEDLLKLIEKL